MLPAEAPGESNAAMENSHGTVLPNGPGKSNAATENSHGTVMPNGPGESNAATEHSHGTVLPNGPGESKAGSASIHGESPTAAPVPPPATDAPRGTSSSSGLNPPTLNSGLPVTGANKERHRIENKRRRVAAQLAQPQTSYWAHQTGTHPLPPPPSPRPEYRGGMCPTGLALEHPAAAALLQYATGGCPTNAGRPWTITEMQAAIDRGPHASALDPEAIEYAMAEATAKQQRGQCRIVSWDDIKHDPPPELKISPIALIPHKSRKFRAILDLSFRLRLQQGKFIPSVNESSVKLAPRAACTQLGHSLTRIIHAFAEADGNEKIFMAKWDIKDGFWRLDCQQGEEWNFAYVLPQPPGSPPKLVVPTSLQMGWIESPPFFCAASETGRDVATQYIDMPVGALPRHKFEHHTMSAAEVAILPDGTDWSPAGFAYLLEVYVDDYIALAIPTTQAQLRHCANGVLHGIHDVFPADDDDDEDPISLKKLKQLEGQWALQKELLGFDFDGEEKTLWLASEKRQALLTILKGWIRSSRDTRVGVPFSEFQSVVSKLRHAFTSIPAGKGLLSPFNGVLRKQPPFVYLRRNKQLFTALRDARALLRESTLAPTKCIELVSGTPAFVGIKDASRHGVGGVIVGHTGACVPTVFRVEWPADISNNVRSKSNPNGKLTNSDLEMAGLLLLWLVMEEVCKPQPGAHCAVFSDNSPTVSWTQRLAAKSSLVAGQLLRALALRLKTSNVSPLTPLHIPGPENSITDIPSRSFGSERKWHCNSDDELLNLFNSHFPLPNQSSWTVFRPSPRIVSRVISVLRMQHTEMDEWRRLPAAGKLIGRVGCATRGVWEWTLGFRKPGTSTRSEASAASRQGSDVDTTAEAVKSKLEQSVRRSRPLVRQSPWPTETTQRK